MCRGQQPNMFPKVLVIGTHKDKVGKARIHVYYLILQNKQFVTIIYLSISTYNFERREQKNIIIQYKPLYLFLI